MVKVSGYKNLIIGDDEKDFKNIPPKYRIKFNGSIYVIQDVYILDSLEGCPKVIGRNLNLEYCENLESLKGGPIYIGGDLNLNHCKELKSLKYGPKIIKGTLYISGSHKISLEELYEYVKNNDVNDIWTDVVNGYAVSYNKKQFLALAEKELNNYFEY